MVNELRPSLWQLMAWAITNDSDNIGTTYTKTRLYFKHAINIVKKSIITRKYEYLSRQ